MKFAEAKKGDLVYNSRLGKGKVSKVTETRLEVIHERGKCYYTLNGEGVNGQLHWFTIDQAKQA
jgi:hypothetical protein